MTVVVAGVGGLAAFGAASFAIWQGGRQARKDRKRTQASDALKRGITNLLEVSRALGGIVAETAAAEGDESWESLGSHAIEMSAASAADRPYLTETEPEAAQLLLDVYTALAGVLPILVELARDGGSPADHTAKQVSKIRAYVVASRSWLTERDAARPMAPVPPRPGIDWMVTIND